MLVHVRCGGLPPAIGVAETWHKDTNGVQTVSGHSTIAVTVITMAST